MLLTTGIAQVDVMILSKKTLLPSCQMTGRGSGADVQKPTYGLSAEQGVLPS
jgi:hypothetical protein